MKLCIDIDGVLIRGGRAIPRASQALKMLQKHSIPFVLLTNGGGVSEQRKSQQLSEKLKVDIQQQQMILCHTPMQELASDKLTLVVGPESCVDIAKSYGFSRVVSPRQLVSHNPTIWPFTEVEPHTLDIDLSRERFDSILVMNDSRDWGLDSQVICDVLMSDDGILGTLSPDHHTPRYKQSIPICFSNCDFTWANDYSVPRFGAGAFRMSVEHLYRQLTGHHLKVNKEYGKPFQATYNYAKMVLERNHPLSTGVMYFGIGDNISSDIVGANLNGMQSLLVKTGVWQESDLGKPVSKFHLAESIVRSHDSPQLQSLITPTKIVDDIQEAVEYIISLK